MANDRLSLHSLLLGIPGVKKVYFQKPTSLKMEYPCVIYKLDDVEERVADNKKYFRMKRYLVTVIDTNPDTTIYEQILNLRYSSFEDHFVVDNLNHYICSLHW